MKILNILPSHDFFTKYWQKKPFVFRNAFPGFVSPISPDELAGLALEEEVESRMVWWDNGWHLQRGPLTEADFAKAPSSHWTLLVQAVDRFVPEVARLLDFFDFIPQWRIDDIMISYANEHGGVGPHYDNYDVFLLQAKGQRKWSLTTQKCHSENYLSDIELRIMKDFVVEEECILNEGDILYLPPHIGHNGVALSKECMTFSFGYRSLRASELLSSYADYVLEHTVSEDLYSDPDWSKRGGINEIIPETLLNAKNLISRMLNDNQIFADWFAGYVTSLDQQAELLLPETAHKRTRGRFDDLMVRKKKLIRNPLYRFAYYKKPEFKLYVNGGLCAITGVDQSFVERIVNYRELIIIELQNELVNAANKSFLFKLWTQSCFDFS